MNIMKKIFLIALIGLLNFGCKEKNAETQKTEAKLEFNQALAEELARMAEIDQIAAYIPQGKYRELSQEQWNSFNES